MCGMAVRREGVEVESCGAFLFALYPGAYVDLHLESLYALHWSAQLRVFSAGVWHNLVVALVCFAVASTAWPLARDTAYMSGVGAVVIDTVPVRSWYVHGGYDLIRSSSGHGA